jgi:RHS repeat-associated protein
MFSFRTARLALYAAIFLNALFADMAFGDCTAQLTLSQPSPGCVLITAVGNGSVGACAGLDIWLRINGGEWSNEKHCISNPCTFTPSYCVSCGGVQNIEMRTTCSRATPSACVPDNDGYDQKSIAFTHPNSLTLVRASQGIHPSGFSVGGVLHVHAPDAWENRAIVYTWLLPDGSVVQGDPAPIHGTADDVDEGFSESSPMYGGTLVATLVSCSDTYSSVAIDGGDDHKCTSEDTQTCPGCCVGEPIHLRDGNMRLSHTDPLPSFGGVSMKRTYDSNRQQPTWFGAGWSSLFDRALYLYPAAVDGPWAVIWLDGTKRYVFHGVQGYFRQMWPLGSFPATLTVDPLTGVYTLREPKHDIEVDMAPQTGLPVAYRSQSTGRALSISYNGTAPTHVSDSWGTFGWTINSSQGRVDSIAIDDSNLTWQYVYSAGNLTAVNGPGGGTWRTYSYSGTFLTEARDAAGNLLESHSYVSGQATSSSQSEGDVQAIQYGAAVRNGNAEVLTRVQSASGAITNYWMAYVGGRARTVEIDGNCSSCGTNNAVFAYRPADSTQTGGQLLRKQDARGYITEWTYDSSDRVIAVTTSYKPAGCDPETDSSRCHQSPTSLLSVPLSSTSATETVEYSYGDGVWFDRPTIIARSSVSNPGQTTIEFLAYDPQTGTILTDRTHGWNGTQPETHETTTVLYDGTETAAFDPAGAFNGAWLTLPQPLGLRKSIDGPHSDVADITRWVYYPVNAAVPAFWRGRLAAVRDAAGNTTRFENYDVLGNPGRVVDPNGVATEYTYDALGRVLTSTLKAVPGCDTIADPLCATDLTTTRIYQPTYGSLASEAHPNGATTTYEYDDRGRLKAIVRPASASLSERLEYDFDTATGKKSAERYLSGQPNSWTLARSEAFRYDIFARLMAVDHPDGSSILYTYDAANNVATVQDENHTAPNTAYQYDPVNRLTRVTQTLGSASGGTIATQYGYDLRGNLTSVTDPNGNVTTYAFDDFDRMKQQVSPVTGTTTYGYDLAGNLISTTDANGATTARTYDVINRVTNATSSRTGYDDEHVSYTYDQDVCGGGNGVGRLTGMDDPSGSTGYCYDRRGLLLSDSGNYLTTYRYDENGNRTSIVYPSEETVTYGFDLADRPRTAALDGVALVNTAAYLPFGPTTQISFGNGATQTMTFDSRYRPLKNKLVGPFGTLAEYDYVSDSAGNVTQIHDAADATYNRDFAYDDLNRLITANSGSSLWGSGGYQYDSMGNMTSLHIGDRALSFSYVGSTPKLQEVTGTNQASITYDTAGNDISDGYYSPRNLVKQRGSGFAGQGTRVKYTYDGRGLRVSRSRLGSPEVQGSRDSVYSPELHLLAQYDHDKPGGRYGDDVPTESVYVWFGDRPIAQALKEPEMPLRYTFADHLGTPLLQTDPDASIAWRAEYEPYGTVYSYRASDETDRQALRFPGQEYDEFTQEETSYNIFRWYRAGWGRYSQADPIGVGGRDFRQYDLLRTTDAFGYAEQDPILKIDPTGRSIATTEGAQAVMVIGGALSDFVRNYHDMRDANTIGADKYFHCLANCEASRRGSYGQATALTVSIAREASDYAIKGDPKSACVADMVANLIGMSGGSACTSCSPPSPCKQVCKGLRPQGLDPKY